MSLDFRVTVYDPAGQNILCNDASADVIAGQYEDTPSGNGAGSLTLRLYREDLIARGYYRSLCIFEISSGDMVLTAPIAAGATKAYVNTNWPVDPANGEDSQLLYFFDGVDLVMRVPFVSCSADAGGNFIIFGVPDGFNGNFASMPAFGTGTTVGRRRYSGRLIRRTSTIARKPTSGITLVGLSHAFSQAVGDVTISPVAAIDVGTALYEVLIQFQRENWPFFNLQQSQFPTVGVIYANTLTQVSMDRFIADVLSAFPNADQWVVRVGHDRSPRLLRVFTESTNSYAYSVTLVQGVTDFEAQGLEIEDEDGSSLYTRIEVSGNTDTASGQPVRAIVDDPAATAYYGFEIDGTPASNTGVRNVTAASTFGEGLLAQNSLAKTSSKVVVYTTNDVALPGTPGNLTNGDVVRAVACLRVTRFDETGLVTNLVADSEIQYPTGVDALWSPGAVGMAYVPLGAIAGQANAWTTTAGSGARQYGPTLDVVPGQTYVLDGYIDARQLQVSTLANPTNAPQWELYSSVYGVIGFAPATLGQSARGRSAPFKIPAGCTSVTIRCYENNSTKLTGTSGGISFAQPNVNVGSFLRPYVPNFASPTLYGIAASVVTYFDAATLDTRQEIEFAAIEPDWAAAIQEKTNGAVTALLQNRRTPYSADSYTVSPEAADYQWSPSSLSVAWPAFRALFARGSTIVTVNAFTAVLQPSNRNFVWINPDGTYIVQQTPESIDTSILLAYFTTSRVGVMGDFFRPTPGFLEAGVGNIDPSALFPAPTYGSATATNGASVNGLASDIDVSVPLTNVPSDGSATTFEFYYRVTVASGTPNAWIPVDGENLKHNTDASVTAPSQTIAFSFGQMTNGATYDLGGGYYGPSGYGPVAVFAAAFIARLIAIGTDYQIGGATLVPTLTNTGATNVPSANGITAAVRLNATITNQPTNHSASKVNFWRRSSASNNDTSTGARTPGNENFLWTPDSGVPLYGLTSVPQPSTAAYSITLADVPGGQNVDFGLSIEDTQGGESNVATIVLAFATQVITINPDQLTFKPLLNGQFYGLEIASDGFLVMPVAQEIYPSASTYRLLDNTTATIPANPDSIAFRYRFQLADVRSSAAMVMLADATTTGTDYSNGYMLQWSGSATAAHLQLWKRTNGSFVEVLDRQVATAGNTAAASSPVVPLKDLYFHELKMEVSSWQIFGGPNVGRYTVIIDIYFDDQFQGFWIDDPGSSGLPAPFVTGLCGPADRDFQAIILIDPKNIQITGGIQQHPASQADVTTSTHYTRNELAAKSASSDGSALRSNLTSRRHEIISAGGSILWDPNGQTIGKAGSPWSPYSDGGNRVAWAASNFFGGSIHGYYSGGANVGIELIQQDVNANEKFIPGAGTWTLAFLGQSNSGYVYLQVQTSSGKQYNSNALQAGTRGMMTVTFTTVSADTDVLVKIVGANNGTEIVDVYAYEGQFEPGSVATKQHDRASTDAVTQTHNATPDPAGRRLSADTVGNNQIAGLPNDNSTLGDGANIKHPYHSTGVLAAITALGALIGIGSPYQETFQSPSTYDTSGNNQAFSQSQIYATLPAGNWDVTVEWNCTGYNFNMTLSVASGNVGTVSASMGAMPYSARSTGIAKLTLVASGQISFYLNAGKQNGGNDGIIDEGIVTVSAFRYS